MSDLRPHVAIVGTGRMGGAMAGVLARAGFPVTVWNRDGAKAAAVAESAGATVAVTAAAAAGAEIVITSLADDAAMRDVYRGPDGLVAGLSAGTVVLDTSTIAPSTVHEVGAEVDASGAGFLDCPVSGSVATVEAGALTIMAGGAPELIEQVAPVLDTLAAKVIHVGGRGAGAAAKLAVNALVHGLNGALAEALVLAEKAGVDRSTAYEVFVSGAAGAPFVQYKRAAYERPDETPVAFSLDLVAKDLELITGLAAEVGAPMEQTQTTLEVIRAAIDGGLGSKDMAAVATHLRGQP